MIMHYNYDNKTKLTTLTRKKIYINSGNCSDDNNNKDNDNDNNSVDDKSELVCELERWRKKKERIWIQVTKCNSDPLICRHLFHHWRLALTSPSSRIFVAPIRLPEKNA